MLSALAVGLAVLAGAILILGLGSPAASSEIRKDPIRKPGDNPFMPPKGDDQPGVTAPPRSGGPFSGNTPGLYGGTMNNASCDADAMVAFLQANPDKAAAWAEVQGIAPAQIPSYIGGLTPVILRADTAVTNHGFANGHATVVPAVLQAGSAVLVDSYGVPRARCYCGNPLTPPASVSQPRYVGESWSGFSPVSITTVEPAPAPMTELALVNPVSNEVFYRPIGTRGGNDRPGSTQSSATQVPSTQPPATQVPVPETPHAQAPAPQAPATAIAPPPPPPPAVAHTPVITSYSTYQEGELIYLSMHYSDADSDAEGFGFNWIVGGRALGDDSYPFTRPSFGRVSPGRVDYPFNHACGQANQYESDVKGWIYDSGGRKSAPIVAHLKCSAPPPAVAHAPVITGYSTYREGVLIYLSITYTDADNDATGFGLDWLSAPNHYPEDHTFANPSYGRVSAGRVDYPFNHACGQANQYESDVKAWIFDSGGRKSEPIVAHLKCS